MVKRKKSQFLFSDLRNFTPLSESLPASELLEVLNAYLTSMSHIVDLHGGVVDKYIGDAVMALFGAPLEMPDQAEQALLTALEMRNALTDLNHTTAPAERLHHCIGHRSSHRNGRRGQCWIAGAL